MASRTLSLLLYNALLPVGLIYMAPAALVKMKRRGGSWGDFGERLGFWSTERRAAVMALPASSRIWMHAVSVGEVGVARKLILELLRQSPEVSVALTTTTPTGHRLALEIEQSNPGRVVALYSPLDLPFVARRVLDFLRPAQIVLVEAEVWPNTVLQATKRGIPVTLVNARLSPRSERRYRQARRLIAPVFGMLNRVCVQEVEDVARWCSLGLDAEKITHTGSIKYDPQGAEPDPTKIQELAQVLQQAGLSQRPLLLAASTHMGEEAEIARIYQVLVHQCPSLGLLLVPRHYERGPEVIADLQKLGIQATLRSAIVAGQQEHTDVLVINSTGELRSWLEHATIVIMGKSFLAEGGQNPAEAVMAGKPVIFGPHMENFLPLVKLLLDAHGAIEVDGLPSLEKKLEEILLDAALQQKLAVAGRQALMRHQGATARTARQLLSGGATARTARQLLSGECSDREEKLVESHN